MGSRDEEKTREAAGDDDSTTDFSVATGFRSSAPPAKRPAAGATASELAANSLIAGRYRVLRKLGQRGFGVVYVAVDQQLNRRVAVKCHLQLFHRAAMLLLELGVPGPAESLLTFADDGFVRHRATAEAARWHGAPEPWLKLAADTGEPTVRHAAYGVIGSMPKEKVRAAIDIRAITAGAGNRSAQDGSRGDGRHQ